MPAPVADELYIFAYGVRITDAEFKAMCDHFPLDSGDIAFDGPLYALNEHLLPRKSMVLPAVDYSPINNCAYWFVWFTRIIWEGQLLPIFYPNKLEQKNLDRHFTKEFIEASPDGMFTVETMRIRVFVAEWPWRYGIPIPFWLKQQGWREYPKHKDAVSAYLRKRNAERAAKAAEAARRLTETSVNDVDEAQIAETFGSAGNPQEAIRVDPDI